MAARTWVKLKLSDSNIRYWIWGIYKVVSYRSGEYYAYFIQDHQDNWGDYVSPPPDPSKAIRGDMCWKSLASAKRACVNHAKTHTPALRTTNRAERLLAVLVETHDGRD